MICDFIDILREPVDVVNRRPALLAKEEVFGCQAVMGGAGQGHEVQQITKEKERGTNHPCRNNSRRSATAAPRGPLRAAEGRVPAAALINCGAQGWQHCRADSRNHYRSVEH